MHCWGLPFVKKRVKPDLCCPELGKKRAANHNSITYIPIRNFYHVFAQPEFNRSNTQSAIGQLRININGVELMSAMGAIRAAANRKDKSLQDFLAVQGY